MIDLDWVIARLREGDNPHATARIIERDRMGRCCKIEVVFEPDGIPYAYSTNEVGLAYRLDLVPGVDHQVEAWRTVSDLTKGWSDVVMAHTASAALIRDRMEELGHDARRLRMEPAGIDEFGRSISQYSLGDIPATVDRSALDSFQPNIMNHNYTGAADAEWQRDGGQ